MAAPRRDFAVTLLDGRRVVGRYHDDAGERSAYVYPLDTNGPILGSGVWLRLPTGHPGARRPRIRRAATVTLRSVGVSARGGVECAAGP
jgi:hypothetical protein